MCVPVNRAQKSLLYTDHMIYSPSVPWFRTRSTNLLDYFFLASVITAPAPNAGQVLRRAPDASPEIEACVRRRAGMVLAVARELGHRNLLLGAWGCGVFRNDPRYRRFFISFGATAALLFALTGLLPRGLGHRTEFRANMERHVANIRSLPLRRLGRPRSRLLPA